MPTLVTALRDHLIAEGIGRAPEVAGPEPPIIRDPQTGTPAPGEGLAAGADAVIGLIRSGGFPVGAFASWQKRPIVDVRLRVRKAPAAEALAEAIEGAIIDRRDWLMGAPGDQLHVIESEQWRAFALVTADAQSYDYVGSFWFELYR